MKFDNKMRNLAIFIIVGAVVTVAQSIITTGVVFLMSDFNVSSTIAQWSYSSFLLVVGVMMPLSAFIARRFKVKTIFTFSLLVFIIGSIICYFSVDMISLIFGRILQAIGNGILMPYIQILLLKNVPEDDWQMFMGVFGLILGFAPVVGSFAGGFIINYFGWRALFSIFTILGIFALCVSLPFININMEKEEYPLDILSVILSIIGCAGVMFGFTNIAEKGFISLYVILPIIVGLISLAIFVNRQGNLEKPLINLKILKNKYFAFGVFFIIMLYFMMNGYTALMPIFIQGVAYHSPIISALIMFPGGLSIIFCNLIGAYLTTKLGVKKVAMLSGVITIIGYSFMIFYTAEESVLFMIVTQLVRYIGLGLGLMPITTWSISMVSESVEDATAVSNTLRQISAAIGSSLVVVCVATLAGGRIGHNLVSVRAFNHTAIIMVVIVTVMLLIAIFIIDDKEKIESKINS